MVRFINIPFVFSFLQSFKTPEATILGLFWVVFHGLLPQIRSNLYKIFINNAMRSNLSHMLRAFM